MAPEVARHFARYPENARACLSQVRQWIFDLAGEYQLGEIEETLKWGEPSYRVRGGSPVRLDWKPKYPDQCALYFVCTTSLVETFREVYGAELDFEGKRAIVLDPNQPLPEAALRHCLAMALRYQSLKHLPLLGA